MGETEPMDATSTSIAKKRGRSLSNVRSTRANNNNGHKSSKYIPNPLGYHGNFPNLPPSTSGASSGVSPKRSRRISRRKEENAATTRDASKNSEHGVIENDAIPNNIQKPLISPKAKPIIVEANFKTLSNVLANLTLTEKPIYKTIGYQKTQVLAANTADKAAIMEKLKVQQFSFYTYTEPSTKPMIYVLKGIPEDFTCEEVLEDIQKLKLPAIKVSYLVNQTKRSPIFLVSFDRNTDVNTNIHTIQTAARYVCHLVATWQRFNRAQKRITQCRNCQLFGHAASQCNRKFRCVKCIKDHGPGECERRTRDQEGTPNCVNCGGQHTANSRACAAYVSYADKIAGHRRRREQAANIVSQTSQGFSASRVPPVAPVKGHKPEVFIPGSGTLDGGRPSSSAPKNTTFGTIGSLQSRLGAIPGIADTLEAFGKLVTALESSPRGDHLGILLSFGVFNYASN